MPAIRYKNAEKKRVPGVTTILNNIGWNKEALLYWANNLGLEGKNHREASVAAMSVGTLAHLALEASIKGEPFDIEKLDCSDTDKQSIENCVRAWDHWRGYTKLEPVASEVSLVSEALQCGGTMDCILVHGRRGVLDFKTGKGLYSDNLLQICAYAHIWNECKPTEPIEECHIIRLGKSDASFHHHMWQLSTLGDAWEAFQLAARLHKLKKSIGDKV